jgi:predicted trehalose synthase
MTVEDPRGIQAWIDFSGLEKAFYGVDDEINNRPAWVHIPLRGIRRVPGGPTSWRCADAQANDRSGTAARRGVARP